MSNKVFLALTAIMLIGAGVVIFNRQTARAPEPVIGQQHPEQSRDHIARGTPHAPYNSDPPSSGPHYSDAQAPALWGVYTQPVPDEAYIHNLEHGGVVITYRPDLPPEQLIKLQQLFAPPYSQKEFQPNRAIVTPRITNKSAIALAAWRYTLALDQYDEAQIKKFYLQHVGKGPEPGAGPANRPINQAAAGQSQ